MARLFRVGFDHQTEAEVWGSWADAKKALRKVMGKKLYSQIKHRLGEGPNWTEPVGPQGIWWFITPMSDE
jgi:hypothetical protein